MKKKIFPIILTVFCLGVIALALKNTFMPSERHAGKEHAVEQKVYFCPMHPTYTSDRPGSCPICHMDLVLADEEPAVPQHDHSSHSETSRPVPPRVMTIEEIMNMKPGEICLLHKCKMGTCMIAMTEEWARLGKCPHCGEDLGVIVKEAMPEGYGAVQLSQEKQQLLGVQTATVRYEELVKNIRVAGTVAYDPALYQAQAEYLQAIDTLNEAKKGNIEEVVEQAERLVQTTEIRLRHLGLSESLIQEISMLSAADRSLLFSVPNESAWVYARIYEYELPLIHPGQKVNVEIPSLSDEVFSGILKGIDAGVDSSTRTIRIRIKLLHPDERLKPDMFVNVVIRANVGKALTVPAAAIFDTGLRKIAFVRSEEGLFEPREVKTGVKTEDRYEVISGLKEGEQVVTSGNFLIDSESRLKAALQSSGAGGHQHG